MASPMFNGTENIFAGINVFYKMPSSPQFQTFLKAINADEVTRANLWILNSRPSAVTFKAGGFLDEDNSISVEAMHFDPDTNSIQIADHYFSRQNLGEGATTDVNVAESLRVISHEVRHQSTEVKRARSIIFIATR